MALNSKRGLFSTSSTHTLRMFFPIYNYYGFQDAADYDCHPEDYSHDRYHEGLRAFLEYCQYSACSVRIFSGPAPDIDQAATGLEIGAADSAEAGVTINQSYSGPAYIRLYSGGKAVMQFVVDGPVSTGMIVEIPPLQWHGA